MAEEIADGRAAIRKYFEMFVQMKPCGKITSMLVQNFGSVKVVDGTYTFELQDGDKKSVVDARYTFVFQQNQGKWSIMTHHSSKQP